MLTCSAPTPHAPEAARFPPPLRLGFLGEDSLPLASSFVSAHPFSHDSIDALNQGIRMSALPTVGQPTLVGEYRIHRALGPPPEVFTTSP